MRIRVFCSRDLACPLAGAAFGVELATRRGSASAATAGFMLTMLALMALAALALSGVRALVGSH
jgi:hypothetical protein